MADPRRRRLRTDDPDQGFRRRIPIDRAPDQADPHPEGDDMKIPAMDPQAPEEASSHRDQAWTEPAAEDPVIGSDQSTTEKQEIRELTDSLVRLQAEFDNYRKRQAREFRRLSSQGKRELISELLEVLDNFDRAENHRSVDDQSPKEISEGLFKTVDQMRRILTQFGLSELDVRVNDPFDPNIHEAVLAREVEGLTRDSVLEILQKGYMFDQELLRPAIVSVGKSTAPPAELPEEVFEVAPEDVPEQDPDQVSEEAPEDDDFEIEYYERGPSAL